MPKLIDPDSYRALADVLIAARLEAGINQTELGARLGVTQKFISVIETGARRVDLLEFLAIERALELPRLSLVTRILETSHAFKNLKV